MIISDILHKAGVIWRFCHDYILIIVLVYNIYICDYKLWIYDYETNAQTGRHIQVGGSLQEPFEALQISLQQQRQQRQQQQRQRQRQRQQPQQQQQQQQQQQPRREEVSNPEKDRNGRLF